VKLYNKVQKFETIKYEFVKIGEKNYINSKNKAQIIRVYNSKETKLENEIEMFKNTEKYNL